jgi:prefoldin subunit 5
MSKPYNKEAIQEIRSSLSSIFTAIEELQAFANDIQFSLDELNNDESEGESE